jgi:hypothetical protein
MISGVNSRPFTPSIGWPHRKASQTLGSVTKGPEKRVVRITVRLPETLHAQIQEAADADRRSKSDWIVIALEKIFEKREKRGSK